MPKYKVEVGSFCNKRKTGKVRLEKSYHRATWLGKLKFKGEQHG